MPTEQGTEIARYEMQGLVTHADAARARAALTDPRADERAALVQGFRAVADFYEEHTEVALPLHPDFLHGLFKVPGGYDDETGPAELARIAEALDVEVTPCGRHLRARKTFHGLEFRAFFIPTPKPTAAQVAAALLQPDAECE